MLRRDANGDETPIGDLLEMGARAAKAGNKEVARAIYLQVLERDRRNERALLALAMLAENTRQRKHYLQVLLKYNPEHVRARQYLERLEKAEQERAFIEDKLVSYGLIVAIVGAIILLLVIGTVLLLR